MSELALLRTWEWIGPRGLHQYAAVIFLHHWHLVCRSMCGTRTHRCLRRTCDAFETRALTWLRCLLHAGCRQLRRVVYPDVSYVCAPRRYDGFRRGMRQGATCLCSDCCFRTAAIAFDTPAYSERRAGGRSVGCFEMTSLTLSTAD